MYRNVIVGVNGDDNGRDAVALARKLLDAEGQLTLAYIRPGESHPIRGSSLDYDAVERERATALLEQERTRAQVDADVVSIASAGVGRGLHRLAEERGADLLVVGSSRRGFWGRVLLGDDMRASLSGAPCAVAIAPHGYAQQAGPIAAIGVAYNGSPESEAALGCARGIAAEYGAQVNVLQVAGLPVGAYMHPGPIYFAESLEQMVAADEERVNALDGVDEGRVVYGLAGEELAAFGDQVDLLIVGSRGYGPVRRLMFGSTSEYLAAHGRCPLLVLRHEAPVAAPTVPASDTDSASVAVR